MTWKFAEMQAKSYFEFYSTKQSWVKAILNIRLNYIYIWRKICLELTHFWVILHFKNMFCSLHKYNQYSMWKTQRENDDSSFFCPKIARLLILSCPLAIPFFPFLWHHVTSWGIYCFLQSFFKPLATYCENAFT